MSKQPLKVVKALRKQKLLLPYNHQDMRQCWLLVRVEPSDRAPGCFFVGHSQNYQKYLAKGFEVLGHGFDRTALTMAAHRATMECGPSFQPKFSSHLETAFKTLSPSEDSSSSPEEAGEEEALPGPEHEPEPPKPH